MNAGTGAGDRARPAGGTRGMAKLMADDRGRYIDVDPAACELLGYTREELLQMSVWDLTPRASMVDGLVLWQQFIRIGFQAGVYTLTRKDGTLVEVEYRAVAKVEPGKHATWLRQLD